MNPPRAGNVVRHLADKLLGGIESLNVPQAGKKVNLNGPAVQIAVEIQHVDLDLRGLFVEGRIGADRRARPRAGGRRAGPRPRKCLPPAAACRSARCWPWESRACCRGPTPWTTVPRMQYGRVNSRRDLLDVPGRHQPADQRAGDDPAVDFHRLDRFQLQPAWSQNRRSTSTVPCRSCPKKKFRPSTRPRARSRPSTIRSKNSRASKRSKAASVG